MSALVLTAKLSAADVHQEDVVGLYRSKQSCGFILLGMLKSIDKVGASLESQLKEGALLLMDGQGYLFGSRVLDTGIHPVDSFERAYAMDYSLLPAAFITICIIALPRFRDYIAKECGGELDVRARQSFEAYVPSLLFVLLFGFVA
jgi:hypothetical protein